MANKQEWAEWAVSGILLPKERESARQELLDHIEDHMEALMAAGFSRWEAEQQAVSAMGNPEDTAKLAKTKNVTSIGIDASKHGADMGAKTARYKKLPAFFAAGNIFSLPVASDSCDAVVSMFAPIPAEETARVLCDNGILVVVASGVRHLWEMRSIIYEEPRENTKGIKCPEGFALISETKVMEKVSLPDNETIMNLFTMTPFYHRCPKYGREKLEKTEKLDVTVEAVIHVYKKA